MRIQTVATMKMPTQKRESHSDAVDIAPVLWPRRNATPDKMRIHDTNVDRLPPSTRVSMITYKTPNESPQPYSLI